MEGSVLSFLRAEWKVSDTGSAQCWASSIKTSELYNYANDNTLSYSDSDKNNLEKTLEMERLELIKWFSINQMKANPEKFQAIAVGKKTKDKNVTFNLEGNQIKCESEVKLSGVTIDSKL